MEKAKYYTVMAGRKEPQKVQQGFLNKATGTPTGDVQDIQIAVGQIMIPNFSLVWGKRIISESGNTKSDNKVSVTDPKYKGELKFLSWGEDGGEAIEIRFLSSSSSLDKQYQDQIQKIKPNDDEGFIYLEQGLNDFDPATESTKILMLKNHSRNGDAKSRNPAITEYDFLEYNPANIYNEEKQQASQLNAALTVVFNADGDDDKVKILSVIQGLDAKEQTDILLRQLLSDAKSEPKAFVNKFTDFKNSVNSMLGDAVEAKLLDISQDGILSLYEGGNKKPLIENIDSQYKGKLMLRFVTDNILDVKIFEAVEEVRRALEKAANNI